MAIYLFSLDLVQLTQSSQLSRLVLAMMAPFSHEADEQFSREAKSKSEAWIAALRNQGSTESEGKAIAFSLLDVIDDPIEGWVGVRGAAFAAADKVLPPTPYDGTFAKLVPRGMSMDEMREDYLEARRFIHEQALVGEGVIIMDI